MRIKLDQVLLTVDGQTPYRDSATNAELTLKIITVGMLSSLKADTREKNVSRWNLALKIQAVPDGEYCELTPEEVVEIKELIDKHSPNPGIMCRAFDLIAAADNATPPE